MRTPPPPTRLPLLSMTQPELAELLGSPVRGRAFARWVFGQRGLAESLPEALDGVSNRVWRTVREHADWPAPRVAQCTPSADGTLKYMLEVPGGVAVETVLIPGRGRSTVCVSSQAGCTRHCAFCATARLGFRRNLTAAEILAQFLVAGAEAPAGSPLRNVVFMGMGEPMDNLDEVLRAVEILTQNPAPQLAAGHVTVSTSGVLPGMRRFLAESRANLALSLNGTTDAQRERLMPQNRVWPIAALLDELRADAHRRPDRLHFIEYVLFEGVNDSEDDARRLLALLQGVRARVNLIPHNAFEGCELRPTPQERLDRFRAIIHAAGVRCLVRVSRGQEIAAACGQLALKAALPAE